MDPTLDMTDFLQTDIISVSNVATVAPVTSFSIAPKLSDVAQPVTIEESPILSQRKFLVMMECLTYAIFTVGAIGTVGNILIVATYSKVGFSDSINISYLSMAISDLGCVLSIVWSGLCWNPDFNDAVIAIEAREVVLPTGGFSNTAFGKTTAMITAFISLERCLCVMFPLKVKSLITHRRTAIYIVVAYVINLFPAALTYLVFRFEWKLNAERNESRLGVTYIHTPSINVLTNFIWLYYGLPLQLIPIMIVLLCTIFLIITLNKSARWRQGNAKATTDQGGSTGVDAKSGSQTTRSKEDRIAKTVLMIAIVFIVCASPAAINNAITRVEPEYLAGESYRELNLFVAGSAACLNAVNSSVNIFIYYNMGSKFRLCLRKLVGFS